MSSEPLQKPQRTFRLVNKESGRLLFDSGKPFAGKRGDEGGWLASKPIITADDNYDNLANWGISPVNDDTILLVNMQTNRYLLDPSEVLKGAVGNDGGWLAAQPLLGTDFNYYNRASWGVQNNGDGSITLINKETKRLLFCAGETIKTRGTQGGWVSDKPAVASDSNYYNRAVWLIEGASISDVLPKKPEPPLPKPNLVFQLVNQESRRLLFDTGNPFTGKRTDEGGWGACKPIITADDNYHNLANWTSVLVKDNSIHLVNVQTNRYLFDSGEPIKGESPSGADGGWLANKPIVGADANYYGRAVWHVQKNGDGSISLTNKLTNRLLFCTGEQITTRGKKGGWVSDKPAVGSDANYYNRANWLIEGASIDDLIPPKKPEPVLPLPDRKEVIVATGEGVIQTIGLVTDVAADLLDIINTCNGVNTDVSAITKPGDEFSLANRVSTVLLEKWKDLIRQAEGPLYDIVTRLRARQTEFENLKRSSFSGPAYDSWKNAALNPSTGLAADLEILHGNLTNINQSIVIGFRKLLTPVLPQFEARVDLMTAFNISLIALQISAYTQLIVLASTAAQKKALKDKLIPEIKQQARFAVKTSFETMWQLYARGSPTWTDATGWQNESQFLTVKAFTLEDGVGLLGRGPGGLETYLAADLLSGKAEYKLLTKDIPPWSNPTWADPSYYRTIRRFVIKNKLYVSMRGSKGMNTWRLDGTKWNLLGDASPNWSDESGFNKPEHYGSIRNFVLNDQAYLVARNSVGYDTWRLDNNDTVWTLVAENSPPLGNDAGYTHPSRYGSVQLFVFNGVAYFVARQTNGISTYKLSGNTWQLLSADNPPWSDSIGFLAPDKYASIRAFVHQGVAYLIGRLSSGIDTYRFTGSSWELVCSKFPQWDDPNGWNHPPYYSTIAVTISGPDAFLIARAAHGIVSYRLENLGSQITWDQQSNGHPFWSNSDGWADALYYTTIQQTWSQVRIKAETGFFVGHLPVLFARGNAGIVSYSGNAFFVFQDLP